MIDNPQGIGGLPDIPDFLDRRSIDSSDNARVSSCQANAPEGVSTGLSGYDNTPTKTKRDASSPGVPAGVTLSGSGDIRHPKLGRPVTYWIYRDERGCVLACVCRFDLDGRDGKPRKIFLPLTRFVNGNGSESWQWKGLPVPRPLYGLDTIADNRDNTVIVVEGEKAAEALQGALPSYVVTTSMNGAMAADKADWTPLHGRRVVIWPDADEPGRKYAQSIVSTLRKRNVEPDSLALISIDTVTLRAARDDTAFLSAGTLPDGWDAADAVAEGWSPAQLETLIASAEPCSDSTPADNAQTEWPEPDLTIIDTRVNLPRLQTEIFGPFWRDWIEKQAEGVSAPPDYVAATLLATASALIGNARWVSPWPSWKEPPVLWIALVGSPSSNKSPAMDPVLDLLRDIEADLLPGHDEALRRFEAQKLAAKIARENWESDVRQASGMTVPPPYMPEAAQEPLMPQRPRLRVSDITGEALAALLVTQPKGTLFVRDELAGWLGNFDRYGGKGGDRAFWLEAYGGRSYVLDRVKFGGKAVHIPHLSVSVLGSIQPDRLASLLMAGDDDGLSARFLYCYPDRVIPTRPRGVLDKTAALAALRRIQHLEMREDDSGTPKPRIVGLTDEAADRFQAWRENHCTNEPRGRHAGWWGKMEGRTLRLALILEYLRWAAEDEPEPRTVSVRATEAAIGLVESYFKPMAARVYGSASCPPSSKKRQH